MDTRSSPMFLPTPPHVATLDALADEIAGLAVHLEAASARLLDLIRELDARAGWAVQGARSCAEWLSYRVGLDLGAAREKVRVARALGGLPKLAAALSRGELSYAKVRALTRVATPETEDRLLGVGRAGTAAHVERIVRGWRRVDRAAEAREAGRQQAGRSLRVYTDDDGMVVIRGRLEPEVGAVVLRALEAAREALHQRARPAQEATPSLTTAPVSDVTRGMYPFDTSAETSTPADGGPTVQQRQADALALVRRRRSTAGSSRARRASGTRWWCTWTPRRWPTLTSPASRSCRMGRACLRTRPAAWRVTPAGW